MVIWARLVLAFAVSLSAAAQALAAATLPAQYFGALGDGMSDDWWAIQQGIDFLGAHGGGTLTLPPTPTNRYVIRQALRMRSEVIIDVPRQETTVECRGAYRNGGLTTDPTGGDVAYANRWPLYGCLLFGSVLSGPNVDVLPSLKVEPQAGRPGWLTLADQGYASRLKAGDLVLAASGEAFTVGTEQIPNWGELDRVEAVDPASGGLKLRYSPTNDMPIRVLTLMASGGASWQRDPEDRSAERSIGIPSWASWRAGIVGGTWIARDESGHDLPFSTGGGGLDCLIKPYAVMAAYGVGYGNLFSRCAMSAAREVVSVTPLELAYLSNDNHVEIGEIELKREGRPFSWCIAFDEASHANTVSIGSLVIGDAGLKDVVSMFATERNRLTIKSISGQAIEGSVVALFAFRYAGAYPPTKGNVIEIGTSEVAAKGPYVAFGDFSVRDNSVVDSRFSGSAAPPPLSAAADGAGNRMSNVKFR